MAGISLPKKYESILINEKTEEFQTYTLDQVNSLILRLPRARRKAQENLVIAWQNWQEKEWEKKKAYARKNIEVCKPGWKNIYSSAKDRDSAILLDEEVQRLEKECIEAEALYKKAVAISDELQEDLNSVKKIYESFLRDDANIKKYPTYGD